MDSTLDGTRSEKKAGGLGLSRAHIEMVKMLAEVAVEQYLALAKQSEVKHSQRHTSLTLLMLHPK